MINTKIIKNHRTAVDSVVTISGGVIRNIQSSSIFVPKSRFSGSSIKWFDDTKLMKGGVK